MKGIAETNNPYAYWQVWERLDLILVHGSSPGVFQVPEMRRQKSTLVSWTKVKKALETNHTKWLMALC